MCGRGVGRQRENDGEVSLERMLVKQGQDGGHTYRLRGLIFIKGEKGAEKGFVCRMICAIRCFIH